MNERGPIESQLSNMVLRQQVANLEAENEQLRKNLDSSKILEQATGAISVRYRMLPANAFEMLREGARSQQRNLHELASEVIANGGSFAKALAGGANRAGSAGQVKGAAPSFWRARR